MRRKPLVDTHAFIIATKRIYRENLARNSLFWFGTGEKFKKSEEKKKKNL